MRCVPRYLRLEEGWGVGGGGIFGAFWKQYLRFNVEAVRTW